MKRTCARSLACRGSCRPTITGTAPDRYWRSRQHRRSPDHRLGRDDCDLATTGLYTGTGAKSGYVVFNRNMFRRVVRAGQTVALQNDITVAGTYMRARQRVGFKDLTKTADKSVRFAFNM